ncbi:type II secretion system F family protein [Nigerium massiliense]|uniref:type II secretion system F family protein n=1 Tax=Nigerium massiliense TaxID=1522317 RepID=UPI000693F5D8|nr:hypothetical protein [Nigerium massiliense]
MGGSSIWVIGAVLAAVAAALLAGPASPRRWQRRLQGEAQPERPEPGHASRRLGAALAAAVVVVVSVFAGGTRGGALALCAVMVVGTIGGLVARHRARSLAQQRRDEVVRAGEVLVGLLRVGQIPATAISVAAGESGVLAEAAAVQAVGGDPTGALRRVASVPGQQGMLRLARAWEVSRETGASMSESIEGASERLAVDHEIERTVAAELSAPRASGRLLGSLPMVGLLLGYVFGGDPIRFLTQSLVGQGCLVAGVGLACLGVWWTDTIATEPAGGRT